MKGTWILVVVAAAGVVLLLRPAEDPVLPRTPDEKEHAGAPPPPQLQAVRSEVQLPEQPPVAATPEPKPTDDNEPPVAPEPPPKWIDEASFVAAGLTREQATDLAEGMRYMHGYMPLLAEQAKQSAAGGVQQLMNLMMLALGPTLADRIEDGSIKYQWARRVLPVDTFDFNCFSMEMSPGSVEPWEYTARGRVGFLTLVIPRSLCDQELLKRLVAANNK